MMACSEPVSRGSRGAQKLLAQVRTGIVRCSSYRDSQRKRTTHITFLLLGSIQGSVVVLPIFSLGHPLIHAKV